jgi:tetraacyldisaccharide 4'-kinase
MGAWRRAAPGVPAVVLHLQPSGLVPVVGASTSAAEVSALSGTRVLAVSAIGAPGAFEAQLRAAGALVEGMAFPDHHAFSAADVAAITARAAGAARVVCTLKDAVKLEALWTPQAPPLWYLSQTVDVEQGGEVLDDLFDRFAGRRDP